MSDAATPNLPSRGILKKLLGSAPGARFLLRAGVRGLDDSETGRSDFGNSSRIPRTRSIDQLVQLLSATG